MKKKKKIKSYHSQSNLQNYITTIVIGEFKFCKDADHSQSNLQTEFPNSFLSTNIRLLAS
jgi:hypothetical protein